MSLKEFCDRHVQTQKAFKYITRNGLLYYFDWISIGEKYAEHLIVAGADENVRKHIMKQYPNAFVSFASEVSVINEHILRENAWHDRLAEIACAG